MPIGKLRYFKPTSENIKDVAWKQYGWFRVCARKTGKIIYIFNNVSEFEFSRQISNLDPNPSAILVIFRTIFNI